MGLIGVALGTLVAMSFRTIFQIHLLKNNAIFRKPLIFWKKIILFSIATFIGISCCLFIGIDFSYNLFEWIKYAIIYLIVMSSSYAILSIICYKDNIKKVINYFKK